MLLPLRDLPVDSTADSVGGSTTMGDYLTSRSLLIAFLNLLHQPPHLL